MSIPSLVDGLHFHCLCEQGVKELRKVLAGFEEKFGDLLPQMKWVNFGGGHHITRADYDVDGLVELLLDFKRRHPHLTVYLEPGEAVALDAGTLEATVLEIQPPGADGISNAILDVSAACHMPDVLEMPYTPRVQMENVKCKMESDVSGASYIHLPASARGRGPGGVRGHGDLFDGEKQHLQRHAVAGHRHPAQIGRGRDDPAVRLCRFRRSSRVKRLSGFSIPECRRSIPSGVLWQGAMPGPSRAAGSRLRRTCPWRLVPRC